MGLQQRLKQACRSFYYTPHFVLSTANRRNCCLDCTVPRQANEVVGGYCTHMRGRPLFVFAITAGICTVARMHIQANACAEERVLRSVLLQVPSPRLRPSVSLRRRHVRPNAGTYFVSVSRPFNRRVIQA